MLHQFAVLAVLTAKFAEVIAVRHVVLEQLVKPLRHVSTGSRCVLITFAFGNSRLISPRNEVVRKQLVGNSFRLARASRNLLLIVLGDDVELTRRNRRGKFGVFRQRRKPISQLAQRPGKIFDLACTVNIRMA